MKRCLCTILLLAFLVGGCADMDMSGFGYIGCTMQDYPTPRPSSSPPADKPVTQLAQGRHESACPTP